MMEGIPFDWDNSLKIMTMMMEKISFFVMVSSFFSEHGIRILAGYGFVMAKEI
jgi:hypothetical protein